MRDELVAAWLALLAMPGVGARTAARFAAHCGGPAGVFARPPLPWLAAHLSPEQRAYLERASSPEHLPALCRRVRAAQAGGTAFMLGDDPDYPEGLARLSDAPPLLSRRGDLVPADRRAVAVVGTRSPGETGAGAAAFLARALAAAGVTVVSGLAKGVDTAAHRAALDAGGRTIAILGCGLDRCYPAENRPLAQAVTKAGCLLSERPPWCPPTRQALLARNRLQAALSAAVVVVQARADGGSFTAARHALRLGCPVFAVRWAEPEFAAGVDRLAGMGAVVGEGEELLERLVAAAYPGLVHEVNDPMNNAGYAPPAVDPSPTL